MIERKTIEDIAQFVAEKFDPERIILFGSYAQGNATEHSDVDLLVVFEPHRMPRGDGNPVRRAIADRFIVPLMWCFGRARPRLRCKTIRSR